MPMSWGRTEYGLGARWSMHRLAFRAGGPVLPPLPLSVPVAFAEQAIEVGEIPVVVDEVPEAFAVGLARPFAGPWFAARIVRVEPDTPEGLPAAMRTALHIAPLLVLPAERHAAVWTGVLFHLSTSTLGGESRCRAAPLNYWHFRRQSLPPTMSLEAQSSALAGRFRRFGTALFDTADCAEWH